VQYAGVPVPVTSTPLGVIGPEAGVRAAAIVIQRTDQGERKRFLLSRGGWSAAKRQDAARAIARVAASGASVPARGVRSGRERARH